METVYKHIKKVRRYKVYKMYAIIKKNKIKVVSNYHINVKINTGLPISIPDKSYD